MNECDHVWEVVREPHQAVREFVVELRCTQCAARKFVEQNCPMPKSERQRKISQGLRLSHKVRKRA